MRADSRIPAARALANKVAATLDVYFGDLTAGQDEYGRVYRTLQASTDATRAVAVRVLRTAGCGYDVRVELTRRPYAASAINGTLYPDGTYDAVVVTLGAGKGEDIGSLAYPRVPASATSGAPYRSLIEEALS